MSIKIGVLGAASYVAGELIKLLLVHPHIEISYLESQTFAGREISAIHPSLSGARPIQCQSYQAQLIRDNCQLLFICKAHTRAMEYVSELQDSSLKIIDLSADFRLKDAALYQRWYGHEHTYPQALQKAVYGMPELYAGQIESADLIANPGCYPTSVILGLSPLLAAGVVTGKAIFADSYSGISGAGNTPKRGINLFLDGYANIKPYKAGLHPHQPEMEQELQRHSVDKVQVTFLPHIAPLARGLLSSISVTANQSLTDNKLLDIYRDFYAGQPFIRIYAPPRLPQISEVVGTNFCAIGWYYDERTQLIVVTSVIDNGLKGAAGQAVQCMNLMYGWEQTTSLPGLYVKN